jgi:hypothetical protein
MRDDIEIDGFATPDAAAIGIKGSKPKSKKPMGSEVLDDVRSFLSRFVAYPSSHAHVAHTLWVAHAHLMDAWVSTPRLAFLSPEPGSGKTRALEVTELLVPRPICAVNCTPAYLFRKVGDNENGLPTVLFDEIDTVFGPKAKENEDLRGLFNAGHRRGAQVGRCVVVGKKVMTEEIEAFSALAVAGLGDIPDTILTRAVVVRMKRRAPGVKVEPYRRRKHEPQGTAIRAILEAWASRVLGSLMDVEPVMPNGVEDRAADVWEPLLAVADAAGGEWPRLAREAAVTFVTESKASSPSLGVRLLEDLRTVFANREALPTATIIEELNKLEESPWATIQKGKPLNPEGLSRRLGKYGVKPEQIRPPVGKQFRGYTSAALAESWSIYLAALSPLPQEPVTPVTPVANPYAAARNGVTGWPHEPVTATPQPVTDFANPSQHPPENAGFVTPVTGVTGLQGERETDGCLDFDDQDVDLDWQTS